jgi:hypothetical protein
MEMTMLLSAHEIVPSILSLEEIGTRPASDIKTASINAKVGVALRKKIASSFSKIAVTREDRLAVRELLGSFRFMIHNTALIYALGLDVEDFPSQQAFRRFRTLSEPSQLVRALKKLKTPEGVSFAEVVFQGTGVADAQKDQLLRKIIDRSIEVTYSIEWVVASIVKQRVGKGGMLYEQAQYIGGYPLGEYVVEKILEALIGRSEDVGSEEDFLSRSSLKKGPKSGTLFYKLFRSATLRKKKIEALGENDPKIGKGVFSWKNRSRFIFSQVSRVNHTMLDIIDRAVKEDKSASFGNQEAFDVVLENVSQAYSDLVDVVNKERTQSDTGEARESLSDARATYKKGSPSEEEKSDYAHAILDLVTTDRVTKEDLRFLLDNLSLISDSESNQKKLRGIVYDKLFRRGQLEPRELVFLDGGYDEATLKRESRSLIKSRSAQINAPVEDDIDGDYDKLENIESVVGELYLVLNTAPTEIYSLRDASFYVSSKRLVKAFKDAIKEVADKYDFSGDIDEDSDMGGLRDHIESQLSYIDKINQRRSELTLLPVGESSGHPLSRYSVSDYTPVQGSKSVDAVTAIAGMATGSGLKGLSARDLSVANAIQRNLTTEAKQAVDQSTSELRDLVRVQQAISTLTSKGKKKQEDVDYAFETLGQVSSTDQELIEEAYSILDLFDEGDKQAGKEAKKLLTKIVVEVDAQKEILSETYKESLGSTVSSLLRDSIKENVGDPARRIGSHYFPHEAVADRTSRQVLKSLGWDTFVAQKTLSFAEKSSDPTTSKILTSIRNEIIKHSGSAETFDKVCKKKGFEVTVDAKGKVTPGDNKKGKKLTNRNAKSIMTGASKELRVSNSFFDEAMSKSEKQIEEEISIGSKEIRDFLSGNLDAIRAFDSFSRNMANGYVQKATEAQSKLTEIVEGEELLKKVTELRTAYIHSNIVTFEDRVKKELKEEHEANLESISKELETRIESLEGQDTAEAREELDDIESGTHEIQRKRGQARKKYQEDVRDALRLARQDRGVSKNYRYAPAVEEQEEAILESYNKVVQAGISAVVNLEATGVGEFFGENSNILTNVKDLSVANRANAIRKINALRNKYPFESRTFLPVYENTREAQVDKITDLIQKDPTSFPSVSQDELERGLLFAFLKTPYPDTNSVVLVDTEGRAYSYPKPNVFSDVGFSVHLQSFFRNLVGAVHPEIKSDDEYKDFRKGYDSTPQGLAILNEEESSLVLTQALGKGMNYLSGNLDTLVEKIEDGKQWQGLLGGTNSITFSLYKNTLNNFKGLLADLNLLMFLASDVVGDSEIVEVGINPNTVESLAEIYKMSEEQIEAMVRADFEKEVEDI